MNPVTLFLIVTGIKDDTISSFYNLRQRTVYPKSFAPLNTDIDSDFFRSFPASCI